MKDKNQLVTVGLLEKILDERLMEFGIQLSDAILQGVQRMFDEQNRKNDLKFATKIELKEEIKQVREDLTSFKRENTTTMSEIMGELKAMREERITGGYRQSRHTDQLENHEQRLRVVETHLQIADK